MRVLLAHPGTQHAARLAAELHRHHLLEEFWTGLGWPEKGWADRAATRWSAAARLRTRVVPEVPAKRLRTLPLLELGLLARLRLGAEPVSTFHQRNKRFQAAIPASAIGRCTGIIGFDTSGWVLAQRCRSTNRPFYLDRSIGHPASLTRILQQHRSAVGAWSTSTPTRPAEVQVAEATEHALAHRIIVGSSFAKQTLLENGVAEDRIRVNPYGVDWPDQAPSGDHARLDLGERPFRFLFVGTVGARKGVPILLRAWQAAGLRDAELWLAGHVEPAARGFIPDAPGLRVLGHLPRVAMDGLFAQTDVLVLPSLFEGFGLVLLEAIAAGLPVITTPHTGGADFLPDPFLGQLVDAGAIEPLVVALRRAYERRTTRADVWQAAFPLRARYSWTAYGTRWAEILREG